MIKKIIFLLLLLAPLACPAFAQEQDDESGFDFDQYQDQYLYRYEPQYRPAGQETAAGSGQQQSRAPVPVTVRPYLGVKGAVSIVAASFNLGTYYDYWNDSFYDITDDSSDTVFTGLVSAGLKIRAFRLEFEYSQRNKVSQSFSLFPPVKQEFRSYMLNLIYDFQYPLFAKGIVPYFGAGLGMTHVKSWFPRARISDKDLFAFSADMGLSFVLSNHFNFDAGLKIFYLGGMTLYREDFSTAAFDFYCGLRYTI